MIKTKPDIESNKERKQDIKIIKTKPNIEFKSEEMMKTKLDTHKEGKAALILGMTTIFTVWWIFK